jgi:hypothetical protein
MQITICDFCKKELSPFSINAKVDNKKYRVHLQKLNIDDKSGVRWKRVDVCDKCFFELLEKMVDKEESPSMAKESSAPEKATEARLTDS